jgi:DNA replication licensing factor MCM5
MVIQCKKCLTIKHVACEPGFDAVVLPKKCDRGLQPGPDDENLCGPAPFTIITDRCEFIDQQSLKLQENPEAIPTSEMPQNIDLLLGRYLVDRVVPGTRVTVMGIACVSTKKAAIKGPAGTTTAVRTQYLRCVGLQTDANSGGRMSAIFSPEEEEELQRLTRDPDIYEKIARSIAPQIQGDYTKDLKRAIACLLFGGSRKVLPDGVKLRGDINVLLMGDPSTAKSQFLKFVERVAPIGVYTSGKGSSAAGLTASVNKNSRGEFFLEGGAMVLADGGVICIDEFDKVREKKRNCSYLPSISYTPCPPLSPHPLH